MMQSSVGGVQIRWPANFNEVPKEIFHREDVYRLELERIFYGPEWHALAHVAELVNPGDFKSCYLGERPVLIVHGDDGRIRVFANSCPHRGTQLKTASRGNAPEIECPYHRWSFNNRGELVAAPGQSDFPESFCKEDYGLRLMRSAQIHGVIFATCSEDAPALEDYLGKTSEYLAKILGGDGRLKLLGYQKVRFDTNWKEYGDNEGYHAPLLHRAFRLLRWQGGKGMQMMTENAHKVISAELTRVPNTGYLNDPSLVEARDAGKAPQSTVISLFPVSIILSHLDIINLRYAFPLSPDRTEVHYAYFSHQDDDEAMVLHRLRQASNLLGPSGLISLEDGAVFNRLHVGSHSSGTVGFQKGVRGRIEAPCVLQQNDEAGNLIRWERYRQAMGFERE